MSELLDAALTYAARGWPVFPCHSIHNGKCSCGNPDCAPAGKHPLTADGFKAATTDESLIRAWWEKYPDANIAIPTGEVSGLAVVDVDDKTGWNELKKILPSHYDWRSVPRQKTGKPDAWHLAFAYPGCHVKSGVRFVPGVDSRGDGGYIMAAPSSHKLGRRYEWKLLPANNDQLPTLPPEFLAAINRTNSNEHRERLNTAELLKGVPKGEQRVTAARLAGKFRHADLPLEAAEELILKFAGNCTPPLSDKEALSQLRGIYRRYPAASYAETSGAEPHEQTQETFWPVPMTAKEFLNRPKDTRRWIVQDVLAFESTSIIVAPARDGKTTLAINLGLSVARGLPFLDRATTAVPVFYLSIDNSASDVDELLKNLSLKESDQFSIHTGGIPLDSIGWFRDMMTRYSYKLAIIDTVQRFFELKDANDYAEATRRMGEIDCLVKELGAHVLYVHHANKSGEFLGTTAFKAMCPTYMQIRRIGEQQQRVLSSDQRNGKNFESLPISFDKYGWLKIVGTLEDVWIEEMKPKITELLEIENTGMSEAQIRQSVEGRGIIVSKAVRQLFGENEIQRTGTGRKGDPFKYFLAANLLRDPSDNPSEDCRPNGGVVGLSQGGILKGGKSLFLFTLSRGRESGGRNG